MKMISYLGKPIKINKDEITFKLDREYDIAQARRLSKKDKIVNEIRVVDYRMISVDQRGKIFSLFRDISEHTGYPIEWVKDMFTQYYCLLKGLDTFSLADDKCTLVQASDIIELVIEFCFENGIPFKYQEYHLASDISRILFLYIKYRTCFICGKPHSDIAHYDAVGMGNNRNKIDHSKHRLMCLCREHHQEQHGMPIKEFMAKYHIVPIKLNYETLVDLKIQKDIKTDWQGGG